MFPSSLSAAELFGISVTLVRVSDGPLSLSVSVILSSDIGLSVVGRSDRSVAFSSDIGFFVVILLSTSSGELSQVTLLLPAVDNTKAIS